MKISKKGILTGVLGVSMLFGAGKAVSAQEGPNFDGIIEGVNISGFATAGYQYNIAKDGTRDNAATGGGRDELATPNFLEFRDDNSIQLENLEVQVFKEATEEHPVGFGFVTNFGEIARNLTFGGRFPNGDHDDNDEDRIALQAGYVQWLIPVGKGIDFKIGKFATWIGAEVIEDVDNPNLTHSIHYNNSIPFTHSGISLGYNVTDNVSATFYLVNGWDSFTDNNNEKTYGWQVAWTPTEKYSVVFNGIHGPEKPHESDQWTHLFDVVGTYVFNDKLSFLANYDFGWTEDNKDLTGPANTDLSTPNPFAALGGPATIPIPDGVNETLTGTNNDGGDAHWQGGALTAIWTFSDRMNLAVRGEYADYTDEFGFSVWEATATLNIKVAQNLLIRPEYRHNDYRDNSDGGGGTAGEPSDDIVAIGFSYIF